jgi:hypothetical protein
MEQDSEQKDKIMDISFTVTLQVDPDDIGINYNPEDLIDTAYEAIKNALSLVENMGFEHPLAHEVSIGVASVETIMEDVSEEDCFICSNNNDANDFYELKARNWDKAYLETLEILGWNVYRSESNEAGDDDWETEEETNSE